jgi:hypothetical protein
MKEKALMATEAPIIVWAVKQNDEILISTISSTRRAAIVNWLVVGPNVFPMNSWTDEMIEDAWERARHPPRWPVTVEVRKFAMVATDITDMEVRDETPDDLQAD